MSMICCFPQRVTQSLQHGWTGLCGWTHRAAINQGFDVRVVLVAQFFLVRTPEVQCPAVAVLGALVGPGHRAVAVVCEALVGLHAQETQEAQLDHAYWLAIGVYVGELGGGVWREGNRIQEEGWEEKNRRKT